MDRRRGKNFGEIWRTLCLWKGTTRSGIEFWLFGYGIRRRRIVSETRVTGLWRIADGRWARPIKLIIHLLQPGGKFKLVLKNSPANGLAKRIGFSKLTTPVKLDGRGPTPSTPASSAGITKINIISRSIYPPLSTLRLGYRDDLQFFAISSKFDI